MVKSGSFLKVPNKFWELQFDNYKNWNNFFECHLTINRHCDHAGLNFYVDVCGFYISFTIFDSRHWDNKKKDWINN